MSEPKVGYHFVYHPRPAPELTLRQIVDQLRACQYRCEAGPLEHNTAFMELERRAREEERAGRDSPARAAL